MLTCFSERDFQLDFQNVFLFERGPGLNPFISSKLQRVFERKPILLSQLTPVLQNVTHYKEEEEEEEEILVTYPPPLCPVPQSAVRPVPQSAVGFCLCQKQIDKKNIGSKPAKWKIYLEIYFQGKICTVKYVVYVQNSLPLTHDFGR